jgi:hypothetical protein
VTRAVADKGRTIRIPIHMVERLNNVLRIERQLVQQLARQPQAEEIAAEFELTSDEVREILRMAKLPLSLEKPLGEEDDSKLADFVEDELAQSPFDVTSLSLQREDIGQALSALPAPIDVSSSCVSASTVVSRGRSIRSAKPWASPANVFGKSRTPRSQRSRRCRKRSA